MSAVQFNVWLKIAFGDIIDVCAMNNSVFNEEIVTLLVVYMSKSASEWNCIQNRENLEYQ